MTVVMGHRNMKVGKEQHIVGEVVGRHGLGCRNKQGNMWVYCCVIHEQVIMNTSLDSSIITCMHTQGEV